MDRLNELIQKLRREGLTKDEQDELAELADFETRAERVTDDGLVIVDIHKVRRKQVEWLWPGYIPRGMLSLVVGIEGEGKSSVTRDLAARLSQSKVWPDGTASEYGTTLFLAHEEDIACRIAPHLDLLGADTTRTKCIDRVAGHSGLQRDFNLKQDLWRMERAIQDEHAKMVIIDPVDSYWPPDVNPYANAEARSQILMPMADVARRTGVALVGVEHLGKDRTRKATRQILNSVAFAAVARAILAVEENPNDPGCRLFGGIKCNMAPLPPTLAFHFGEKGQLEWEPLPVPLDMRAVLEGRVAPLKVDGKAEEAMDFLKETLASGPVQFKEVERMARERGITPKILRTARENLGVKTDRVPGVNPPVWIWTLP